MNYPFIAYLKKGHIAVIVKKNMGCGFYKCCNLYKPKNTHRDIYILNLEDKQHKPITKHQLAHLPKLWGDE